TGANRRCRAASTGSRPGRCASGKTKSAASARRSGPSIRRFSTIRHAPARAFARSKATKNGDALRDISDFRTARSSWNLRPGEELPQATSDEEVPRIAEKIGASAAERGALPLEGE